jgi:AmmeMemoRadiSam system protein B
MIRKPAVAGQFYPSSKEQLLKQIDQLVDKKAKKKNIIGCVLPHAGYIYSGAVAGETVSEINIPDNVLLIGPNHTGIGEPLSLMKEGIWQTPLGEVSINKELAEGLLKNSKYLKEDLRAHTFEHSLEVQLPFLQYFKADFKIIPIIAAQVDLKTYKQIGGEIALTLEKLNLKNQTLLLASSDMTHYEPDKIARKKDNEAIQAILELDEDKLFQKVTDLDISMCGYVPTIIIMTAAKQLGAKKANLVKYQTSGDTSGDYSSVVGYAGITFN